MHPLVLEKGNLFLTNIKANSVNILFAVWNFKDINWEHVEFDEGKSQFLLFLVVYHILSKTETWTFLRLLLHLNSSEMQFIS